MSAGPPPRRRRPLLIHGVDEQCDRLRRRRHRHGIGQAAPRGEIDHVCFQRPLCVAGEGAARLLGMRLEVGNARQAYAALEAHAETMQGVITDINLGKGPDGWAIGKQARQLVPTMPLVYVSGASQADWAAWGTQQRYDHQAFCTHATDGCYILVVERFGGDVIGPGITQAGRQSNPASCGRSSSPGSRAIRLGT
jgi:hypothetical protein